MDERMDDKIDFSPIDPTQLPNFDAIVNRIVEDAAEARDVVSINARWFRPALLAAVIATVIAIPIFRANSAQVATQDDELAKPQSPIELLQFFGREI